jgi:hypothetical protein
MKREEKLASDIMTLITISCTTGCFKRSDSLQESREGTLIATGSEMRWEDKCPDVKYYSSSIHNFTTIRMNDLSGDVGAIRRRKKQVGWCNLHGLPGTLHRYVAAKLRDFV